MISLYHKGSFLKQDIIHGGLFLGGQMDSKWTVSQTAPKTTRRHRDAEHLSMLCD